ncbi:MAG: chemotaxis protein CheC [Salinigranum sp.]
MAVTKVEVSSRSDVTREFGDRDVVSVRIGISGGIEGQMVLAFPREGAKRLVENVMPGATAADDLVESGLNELGNIMIGGFVDGWADYLGTPIEISTPTYVDVGAEGPLAGVEGPLGDGEPASGADVPADDGESPPSDGESAFAGEERPTDDERVLVFRNQVEATDEAVNFDLFMVPVAESIGVIADTDGGESTVPLDSFTAFSRMIAEGAQQASSNISMMTGIDTEVEVCRLNFVPIEGVPAHLDDDPRTGVVLEFEGTPSGYLAILFDDASARSVASALLPGMDDGGEEMRQSAIEEIGNIVTSGFVDGWANALETKIEITPPTFVNDLGPAIVDPLVADLARNQEYAFLIDSTIRTGDDEFTCDIYALPDESELRVALNRLAPSAV